MTCRKPVSGVLLSAGASSRMGECKPLLPWGEVTLIEAVTAELLRVEFCELVVVLGREGDRVSVLLEQMADARIKIARNRDYARGVASSLQAGLAACSPTSEAAAVLLADQPTVGHALVDRVIDAWLAGDREAARPVYTGGEGDPVPGQRVPGHPVLLGRSLWPSVAALSGEQGARELFAADPSLLLELELEGPPPPDIDSHDDYLAALADMVDAGNLKKEPRMG
ncbi:MAG: nucleotidyltransferase family protein [Deltaproteobacteria bacterium]|nr:nucleotidyltransferase family protein [Deltaproteobacteria bacterium]